MLILINLTNGNYLILVCLSFVVSGIISVHEDQFYKGETWIVVTSSVLGLILLSLLTAISIQPKSTTKLTFTVSKSILSEY